MFTKSLTEKSILKKRGTLPMCIVRPAMVGASMAEPFPGWTDTLAAVGAPILFGGIGIYNYMVAKETNTICLVPVDYCINSILICTVHAAFNSEKLHVYNHSSSARREPVTYK